MNLNLTVTDKTADESVSIPLVVEGQIFIGRYLSSPIPLQGVGLSRNHFALEARGDLLLVEDLSSNGTWLNGERLSPHKAQEVRHGDLIEVPGYGIAVSIPGADPQRAEPIAPELGARSRKPAERVIDALVTAKKFFTGFEIVLVLSTLATITLLVIYMTT